MTLTKPETEYQFTAPIVGKSKRGSAWALEFDWRLPGSKFNFVAYERNNEMVEGWNIGDCPLTTITQGALKEGKDGIYTSDYFYDLVSIERPDDEKRRGEEPPQKKEAADAESLAREGPPPLPQALGACQNHAMAFIQSGIIPVPEDRDPVNFLWELRDRVYRNVNQRPFQPEHYCYSCERERKQSPNTKKWGHRVEGGWCIENEGILPDKP